MLIISPLAAEQARQALYSRGQGLGLRLQVLISECEGLNYQLEFADFWQPYELQFASEGITLGVSADTLPLVNGVLIDFMLEGEDAGFIIRNPNVKNQCHCGESFYV